jgi:uncharacterized protein (TIGR02266 family)
MKTILDLIGEFAVLNDAKVLSGGKLRPEEERRFQELKAFYELLMSHTGVTARSVSRRFSAEEVLAKVTARERLRVPLDTEMVFAAGGEFHAGYAVNLSRGGLFLSAREMLPVRSPVTIYLSSPDAIDHALMETPAEVVWVTERGLSGALIPPGMGIRFTQKKGLVETYLDAMVVDSIVRHLSGVDATSLAPEFIGRELVEL